MSYIYYKDSFPFIIQDERFLTSFGTIGTQAQSDIGLEHENQPVFFRFPTRFWKFFTGFYLSISGICSCIYYYFLLALETNAFEGEAIVIRRR